MGQDGVAEQCPVASYRNRAFFFTCGFFSARRPQAR